MGNLPIAIEPSLEQRETVSPELRIEFLERHLGSHDAVNLVVSEATGAMRDDARGPFAHSLTIERKGKGFVVQDIAVDSDGNFFVSEHAITRRGRFVQHPGESGVTSNSTLINQDVELRRPSRHPSEQYRSRATHTVLDRLIVEEERTNDVREYTVSDGIKISRGVLDQHLKEACQQLGVDTTINRIRLGTLEHPLADIFDRLRNLALGRAAQEQLAETLNETGLDGFTLSGDDPM